MCVVDETGPLQRHWLAGLVKRLTKSWALRVVYHDGASKKQFTDGLWTRLWSRNPGIWASWCSTGMFLAWGWVETCLWTCQSKATVCCFAQMLSRSSWIRLSWLTRIFVQGQLRQCCRALWTRSQIRADFQPLRVGFLKLRCKGGPWIFSCLSKITFVLKVWCSVQICPSTVLLPAQCVSDTDIFAELSPKGRSLLRVGLTAVPMGNPQLATSPIRAVTVEPLVVERHLWVIIGLLSELCRRTSCKTTVTNWGTTSLY